MTWGILRIIERCQIVFLTCQESTRTGQSLGRPLKTSADTGWHSCPWCLYPPTAPLCDASSLEEDKQTFRASRSTDCEFDEAQNLSYEPVECRGEAVTPQCSKTVCHHKGESTV